MNPPKIVFFDIDDTLYRKRTDTLRPSVKAAVAALKQRGILTAIATGRTHAAIPEPVRALIEEAGMDLLLTINGQIIRYRNDIIARHPLMQETVAALCGHFERQGTAYAFVADDCIAVSAVTPEIENAMKHIYADPLVDKTFYRRNDVFQMLAFYDASREQEMAELAARHGCKTVRWHEQSVDILNTEGSKARGIAQAVGHLGIGMHDVMAFGDGLNDMEMIQAVGFGVAMGNAHPDLKAVADYICPTVEEDGVYHGLKALGIID